MAVFTDLGSVLEKEVINAYYDALEEFDWVGFAPDLNEIYEKFYGNAYDNICDAYEEVFGQGSSEQLNKEWLVDLGIDPEGIPPIKVVCKILNAFKLGFTFRGVLFNIMPQKLPLKEEAEFYEDVLF